LIAVTNPDLCKILWKEIDSHENKVVIKSNGIYSVYVENQFGCIDSAIINVELKQPLEVKIISDNGNVLCKGESVRLSTNKVFKEYLWSTGEKSSDIIITKGGWYQLHVFVDSICDGVDSIFIEEFEKPVVGFEKPFYTICKGDGVVLSPLGIKPEYEYIWSDGLKSTERVIKDNVDLFLIAKTVNGCQDTSFVKVQMIDMPIAKIIANNTQVCFGEKITLKADDFNPDFDYLWSTGERSESIIISKSGKYKLTVNNKNLCFDSTDIDVIIYSDLNPELTSDKTTLCFDDSTVITPKAKYDKYLWSTGDTTETLKVYDAGLYQLIVQNNFGCSDTTQIEIFKYYPKLISDTENLIFEELCLESSITKNIKFSLKSDFDFKVSKIYLNSDIFKINNSDSFLKSYKDGDTFELPITFKPSNAGEFIDSLIIESYEPCYYKKSIHIMGTSKSLFLFSLPNIISEAGNNILIPISAEITCPNLDKLYSDYEMEISFDKEYFIPVSIKVGEIVVNRIENQNRIIKIKGFSEFTKRFDSLLPINIIYGTTLVGRKDSIPLTIDYVNFTNKRYYPEYINGSLKIEGCVNNLRPIQIFIPTKLSIAPNPSDGDIKMSVGTQEKGSFKVEIFNLQGQCIYTKEFTKSNSSYEEFEYFYDTQEIGSGVYSVHLTSPWHVIRQQLVISK
jgi:hypothetical protein